MTKTVMNFESDDKNYKLQKSATQQTTNHYCPVNLMLIVLKCCCSNSFRRFENFWISAKKWFFAT